MEKKQKDYLKELQSLCEFAKKPDVTGIDIEYVFQVMQEPKTDEIWDKASAKKFQREVLMSLLYLAKSLYHPDVRIEIKPPSSWHQIINDGEKIRLISRITSGPDDNTLVRSFTPEGPIPPIDGLYLPLLVYRAIELLTHLPLHTLRVCKAEGCHTVFVSLHKTKAYCSPRCRNRVNTYANRKRGKGIGK